MYYYQCPKCKIVNTNNEHRKLKCYECKTALAQMDDDQLSAYLAPPESKDE